VPSREPVAAAPSYHDLGTPLLSRDQAEEIEKLRKALTESELENAAHKVSALNTPTNLASVIAQQTAMFAAVLDKPKAPNSTIRVEPKVFWPKLGDDGPGGREVEVFYEKYEEICGLANNGTGMSNKEMMVALKSCLHGSRKKIFENIVKANKTLYDTDGDGSADGPGQVYALVKKRLFRFLETSTEKQLRVQSEWENLTKSRGMSALQFEAEWEQVHADLEEIGLALNPQQKFLQYIMKVGPPSSENVRQDRRPRPDGKGGLITRLPETWEECHEVLCEQEGVKSGSRAFAAARSAGVVHEPYWDQTTYYPQGGLDGGKGGGKRKGKDEKGKGKGKVDGKGKPVCYNFLNTGSCNYGTECRFSHDPVAKAGGQAPQQKRQPAQSPPSQQDQQSAGVKGGYEKGVGKRTILCKYIKDKSNGPCPLGPKNCPFCHYASFFENGKYVGNQNPRQGNSGKGGGKRKGGGGKGKGKGKTKGKGKGKRNRQGGLGLAGEEGDDYDYEQEEEGDYDHEGTWWSTWEWDQSQYQDNAQEGHQEEQEEGEDSWGVPQMHNGSGTQLLVGDAAIHSASPSWLLVGEEVSSTRASIPCHVPVAAASPNPWYHPPPNREGWPWHCPTKRRGDAPSAPPPKEEASQEKKVAKPKPVKAKVPAKQSVLPWAVPARPGSAPPLRSGGQAASPAAASPE
jgi:hypothetical protein